MRGCVVTAIRPLREHERGVQRCEKIVNVRVRRFDGVVRLTCVDACEKPSARSEVEVVDAG